MSDADREPAREPEIATGTLAEIYAQQGLFDRALEIYRRIERRRPDDPEVARRIAALEEARDRRAGEGEPAADTPTAIDPEIPSEETPAGAEADRRAPARSKRGDAPERGSRPGGEPSGEGEEGPGSRSGPATFRDDDEAFREWLERR